jgi:hypothetical protein
MDSLVLGLIGLALGILGLWIALPRDGQVRGFLRNDHVQAYYTVAVISLGASGAVAAFSGLLELAR